MRSPSALRPRSPPATLSRGELLSLLALPAALTACHRPLVSAAAPPPAVATLPIRTPVALSTVEATVASGALGPMALYPDPVLRRRAAPVERFGPELDAFARLLLDGMVSQAITAIQFGVDACVVALKGMAELGRERGGLVLVNPRIVARSDESSMRPWREVCLVLPETLEVELLRDEWVDVEYADTAGSPRSATLRGEAARAFQHELDHLNGILIVDHAALDELPAPIARIERGAHAERQARAFARPVDAGT